MNFLPDILHLVCSGFQKRELTDEQSLISTIIAELFNIICVTYLHEKSFDQYSASVLK